MKIPSRFEQHKPKGCLVLLLTTAGASYKAAPDLASIPNTALTPSPTLLVTCWGKEKGLLGTGVTAFYRGGTRKSALPKSIHYKSVEPGFKP